MKRLIALVCVLAIFSCKEEPKDYATLSGKITNPNDSKIITVLQGRDFKRDIKMNDDGTFNDTLKVKEGAYYFKHGAEYGQVYLKNDNTINLTLDNENFDETLKFEEIMQVKVNFSLQIPLCPVNN